MAAKQRSKSKSKSKSKRAKTTAKAAPARRKAATKAKAASKSNAASKSKAPRSNAPSKSKAKVSATGASKRAKTTQAKRAPEAAPEAASSATEVQLGEVTAPSGTLVLFDVGLLPYLPRPALEPALVTVSVPADRALPVVGTRVGKGRFADCWDHVAVVLSCGEVTHSKKLGEAGVDFARLVCMDHRALDHWQHEDSLDGLADFVFWGRDAAELAKALSAPAIKEGHGWTNLPIAEAEAKAMHADRLKADHRWLLATDLRPHSHHFQALSAARKTTLGAGTIEVGGARVCLFFTSWGDGVFPIYLDLDHDDRPVRVRVQLNTADSMAAMHAMS